MNERQPTDALGLWLREQRKHSGFSQADVASALGINPGTVSNWELKPEYRPSRHRLPALSELFGVPLTEVQAITGHDQGRTVHGLVVKPISLSGRKGCPECEAYIPCKQAVLQGLPILCERVTEVDVQAAKARGMEQELLASRRL